jgi:hypothetical protein
VALRVATGLGKGRIGAKHEIHPAPQSSKLKEFLFHSGVSGDKIFSVNS